MMVWQATAMGFGRWAACETMGHPTARIRLASSRCHAYGRAGRETVPSLAGLALYGLAWLEGHAVYPLAYG